MRNFWGSVCILMRGSFIILQMLQGIVISVILVNDNDKPV